VRVVFSGTKQEVLDAWLVNVVTEYSGFPLTNESDRLPALSGLASQFGQLLNCEYLAGLWRNVLPRALLWILSRRKARRSRSANIPTWSWVSIEYLQTAEEQSTVGVFFLSWGERKYFAIDSRCRVISTRYDPNEVNRYSSGFNMSLCLQAATISIKVSHQLDTWIRFDVDEESRPEVMVWLLIGTVRLPDRINKALFLVLRQNHLVNTNGLSMEN
jgi:hypothetical protein